MLPEARPHARLEDRDIPRGVQAAAVDETDAAMPAPAVLDELLYARRGFSSRLTMQVEPPARRVLPALQFSEFTPVHTGGRKGGFCTVFNAWPCGFRRGSRRRSRRVDMASGTHPAAWICG